MRRSRALTEDGFEETMAANHLGHFLLVNLLLPDLLQLEAMGKQPRVVVVGSNICYAHDVFDFSELTCAAEPPLRQHFLAKPYSLFRAYGQSKLANLMMCRQLALRLRQRGSRIQVNCVHPGEVLTQVFNDFHPVILALYSALQPAAQLFFKTPPMGAVCPTFVAASPDVKVSGEYFMRCRPAKVPQVAQDSQNVERLWVLSEELTGIQSCI
ncbi:TIC32B [Symbiodinium natans]|uniref:TIC32B protein n=1 Tax=Symbiodinium natans TaxID=878477 RepID=A0A812V9L0_9DINO|nr:TIC32B [Symbiodinium natans]